MIYKTATCVFDIAKIIEEHGVIKTAASQLKISSNEDAMNIVKAAIHKHPTALFIEAKAIVADEVNANFDFFSTDEVMKAAQTFVGVPFFTNHENQDIEKAKGKIIYAKWDEQSKAVYVIAYIDREAHPELCRGIEEEYMSGVSMGAVCDYSRCSICDNRADTPEQYCPHVKHKKGRKFTGTVKNVTTGEIKQFRDALVYEKNYGLRFIELSAVGDPACRSCRINTVYDNQEFLRKTASIQNNLWMLKSASLSKNASQQEIEQLNQALETLEKISVSLIQNRKNVEVEFASDLVSILQDLQQFTDELVGAGYGQLNGAPGGDEQGMPGADGGLGGDAALGGGMGAQPVSMESDTEGLDSLGGLGDLGGGDLGGATEPMGAGGPRKPAMPTAPAKAAATKSELISKISSGIRDLSVKISSIKNSQNKEDQPMARRTPANVSHQKTAIIQDLNKSWQESGRFSKNPENTDISGKQATIILSETTTEGVTHMAANKTASHEAPDQITERQLDSSRTESVPDQTTQVQIESKRSGKEAEQITQVQIESKRTGKEADQITQSQIESKRSGKEAEQITQVQLDAYRTGNERNEITEKQLNGSEVMSRKAMARTQVKTANEHVSAVIKSLAEASLETGATPEQTQAVASEMVSTVMAQLDTLDQITRTASVSGEKLDTSARLKYWGAKGITLAAVSKDTLKTSITAKLNTLVASDEGIHPQDVVDTLSIIGEEKAAASEISKAIDSQMKSATVASASSRKDLLKQALLSGSDVQKRSEERSEMLKSASAVKKNSPTHVIEATIQEIGITKDQIKNDKPFAKKAISAFAKGVTASNNKKFGGITNVKVDGDNVEIAIAWGEDDDQKVNLALGDEAANETPDTLPEGDTAGEGLDGLLNDAGGDVGAAGKAGGESLPSPGTPAPTGGLTASAKTGLEKTAQFGGAGGGMPGASPTGAPGQPNDVIPSAAPTMDQPVQSLTDSAKEGEGEEKQTATGEQLLPGSICPFCHSDDTNCGKEGREADVFDCNACGMVYSFHVSVEVKNPEKMSVEKDDDTIEKPNLPELPVAACVELDAKNMTKLASLAKQFGDVCPACGMTDCKPTIKKAGLTEFTCPSCETTTVKEHLIDKNNLEKPVLRVAWNIIPKKVATAKCEECEEAQKELLASKQVKNMLVKAASKEFPMANCLELVARKWGANTVASYGECKGKPLAECTCKQLKTLGLDKKLHLNKLASVYAQKDPMEECVNDHVEAGYQKEAATMICNCMKKEAATEKDENSLIMAFADSKEFSLPVLRKMAQAIMDPLAQANDVNSQPVAAPEVNEDEGLIGDELPEKDTVTVTVELPKAEAQNVADQVSQQTEAPDSADKKIVTGEPDNSEVATPVSASSKGENKMEKTAEKPKHVDSLVDAGNLKVPQGDATLGHEQKFDAAKPSIPSGDALIGKEQKIKADAPDIPTGKATMGGEAEAQKGLPGTNLEMRGQVVTAGVPTHVDNLDKEVSIPRAEATMGKEQPPKAAAPSIPTGKALMGKEKEIPAAQVNVPEGNAYMGHESEAQKGLPGNSVKSLNTVRAGTDSRERHQEKIQMARYKMACKVASRLLGEGKIEADAHDEVIEVLASLEVDKIESYAAKMYKSFDKRAATQPAGMEKLASAIVIENKSTVPDAPVQQASIQEQMADLFTTGSRTLTAALLMKDRDEK